MTFEIILQHGWGHNASCWNGLQRLLLTGRAFPIAVQLPDRGYFDKSFFQRASTTGTAATFAGSSISKLPYDPSVLGTGSCFRVLIAHSFGLHLIPSESFAKADLLIIFGGFLHFHPKAEPLRRRSERILRRMHDRFEDSPLEVLFDFHARSGSPPELVESIRLLASEARVDLLLSDLKQLSQSNLEVEVMAQCPNIAIFHGTEDSIVPIDHSEHLHRLLPQSRLFRKQGGNHALPFTHTQQCFKAISELLDHQIKSGAQEQTAPDHKIP